MSIGRRIDPLQQDDLTPEQADLYARILGGPRAAGPQYFSLTAPDGSLVGPFNALLLSPGLGGAVQELGAAVRYQTQLSSRIREMAILVVAAHWHSTFETAAHEAVGRAIGLTEEELTAIAAGDIPTLDDEYELACIRIVDALTHGDIDDELWVQTRELVSTETVFELVTLVGYYAGLALQMRVFRV